MLNSRHCEIARLLTKSDTTNAQIRREYQTLSSVTAGIASQEIDLLLKEHERPIDEGFDLMADDFAKIAKKYGVSPATLFCIFMKHLND